MRRQRWLAVALAGVVLVAGFSGSAYRYEDPALSASLTISPDPPPGPCPLGATPRAYEVTALRVPLSYNNWGDFDPQGRIFVMTGVVDQVLQTTIDALNAFTLETGQKVLGRVVENLTDALDLVGTDPVGAAAHLAEMEPSFFRDVEDVNKVLNASNATGFHPFAVNQLVTPLVLRAHPGDCVIITLTNLLPEFASIHVHGLVTRPGQGMALGANLPDLTAPGGTGVYVAYVPADVKGVEGAHFLHSHGDSRYQTKHGLFGALVVEPAEARWSNPDGSPVRVGPEAIISFHPEDFQGTEKPADFREFVLFYHDEVELYNIVDPDLNQSNAVQNAMIALPTVGPSGEYGPGSKALNLRTEPFMDRFLLVDNLHVRGLLPKGADKSQAYGSYTYGDPATFFARAYVGDPTKWRLVNAGPGQHHVHHLHGGGDRWRISPTADDSQFTIAGTEAVKFNDVNRSASDRVDVQSIGPGETFNAEIEGGAGGVQRSVGDFLYHCHIVEHYVAGMWSFWRVYNTKQLLLNELPDRGGVVRWAVNSTALLDKTHLPNGTLVTNDTIGPWVASLLPPPGVPGPDDATVWDWIVADKGLGPLYVGEPEDNLTWPNFVNPNAAVCKATPALCPRPEVLFDPDDGRLAYPLLRPHLGKRPPFAPDHGPAPHLKKDMGENPVDGLCPQGAPPRDYRIVATPAVLWPNGVDRDDHGMIFVHAKDKDDRVNNTKSLVLRANQGDCVDITFASLLKDDRINKWHSKVNMHIHLVQFDVQASDGVISGFAYEQSVRPAHLTGTKLSADLDAPTAVLPVADASKLRNNTLVAVGLTNDTVEVRRIVHVNPQAGTVTLDDPVPAGFKKDALVGHEFVRYRWYPDVELGMVYWHDHVDGLHGWQHGLFGGLVVEPKGSWWCDPKRFVAVKDVGNLSRCAKNETKGHLLDIVNPDEPSKSYRELVLQVQDRLCVNRPQAFQCSSGSKEPDEPSVNGEPATFNLKGVQLHRRNLDRPLATLSPGSNDPALDDPPTDLLEAYPRDNVTVRLLYAGQSSTTGVGTFAVTGHRFRYESNLTGSRLTDALSLGISSQHNVRLDCGAGGCSGLPGDYLYYMANPDFLHRGAWGVFRVHDQATNLTLLPNNRVVDFNGTLAPPGVSIKYYNVTALEANVTFKDHPLLNPTGPVNPDIKRKIPLFVEEGDLPGILNGSTTRPPPLVLRVKAGQLVNISVQNNLTEPVTVSPSLLTTDPHNGTGVPVGTNPDLRVPPNAKRWFEWYADKEVGLATIWSFGKLTGPTGANVQQPTRGLYGAIVVEPAGPADPVPWSGPVSTITVGSTAWREHVLLYGSDDDQFMSSTMKYLPDVRDGPGLPVNVNYRTDPLSNRTGSLVEPIDDQLGGTVPVGGVGLHSCHIDPQFCGADVIRFEFRNPLNAVATMLLKPETPIVDVQQGQPLLVRAANAAGDQLTVHSIDGHWWARDPDMASCRSDFAACNSTIVSSVALGPREATNAFIPRAGPGGAGDYLYGSHRDPFHEAGAWGIVRACVTGPLGGVVPGGGAGVVCTLDDLGNYALEEVDRATEPFRELAQELAARAQECLKTPVPCVQTVLSEQLCHDDTNATASREVVIPAGAAGANQNNPFAAGFNPRCAPVLNDGTVTFRDADPGPIHDPATRLDSPQRPSERVPPACFKSAWDRDGDNNQVTTRPGPMVEGQTFSVRLRWDGSQLLVSVDGGLMWRDCTEQRDPATSNAQRAVLPYQCDIHPNMRGEIVVRAPPPPLGGGGGGGAGGSDSGAFYLY